MQSFNRKKCKKVFINRLEHMLNKIVSLQTVYMNLFGKYSLQKNMVQTLTREHNKLHRSVLIRSNSLALITLVNVRICEGFSYQKTFVI